MIFLVGTPIGWPPVAGRDRVDDIDRQLAQANPLTPVGDAAFIITSSG